MLMVHPDIIVTWTSLLLANYCTSSRTFFYINCRFPYCFFTPISPAITIMIDYYLETLGASPTHKKGFQVYILSTGNQERTSVQETSPGPLLQQTNPSLKTKHTWNPPDPMAFYLSTLCLHVALSHVSSTP